MYTGIKNSRHINSAVQVAPPYVLDCRNWSLLLNTHSHSPFFLAWLELVDFGHCYQSDYFLGKIRFSLKSMHTKTTKKEQAAVETRAESSPILKLTCRGIHLYSLSNNTSEVRRKAFRCTASAHISRSASNQQRPKGVGCLKCFRCKLYARHELGFEKCKASCMHGINVWHQ